MAQPKEAQAGLGCAAGTAEPSGLCCAAQEPRLQDEFTQPSVTEEAEGSSQPAPDISVPGVLASDQKCHKSLCEHWVCLEIEVFNRIALF